MVPGHLFPWGSNIEKPVYWYAFDVSSPHPCSDFTLWGVELTDASVEALTGERPDFDPVEPACVLRAGVELDSPSDPSSRLHQH